MKHSVLFVALLSPLVSLVLAQNCISIDSTDACSPWAAGLKIDTAALSAAYGVTIETASQWNEIVKTFSRGGPTQGKLWSDYLHCPTYQGDPIQYYRTYVCLTDIFQLSKSCNPTATISPTIYPEVCDVYSAALKGIVNDCPTLANLVGQDGLLDEKTLADVFERRKGMLSAKETCKELVTSNSKSNETQVWGVKDDQRSCGFASNPDVAYQYCRDVKDSFGQTPKCCSVLPEFNGKTSGFKALQPNSISAQAAAESGDSQSQQQSGSGTNVPLIAGSVGGGVAVLAAVGAILVSRRRSFSKVSTTAPQEDVVKFPPGNRHQVITEYAPTMDDELELMMGDLVEIHLKYADDWCRGVNISSGKIGLFPHSVVRPV
ncbi:E3 ubiquitin-protein ligase sh3rf1 [Nowakowskiella sp. JEL0407]|nr:E3 ubiquitin-protein ligase sh3rf1 [Nowakowskiella sp. JEL0407]